MHGLIKQENRVVPVHFQFGRKQGGLPEFIERKLPDVTPGRHRRCRSLAQIEATILAVAAGAAVPGTGFSLWALQNDAERAGLSKAGVSLSIKRLCKKILRDNDKGWEWIDANEERFILRKPVPERASSEITDEIIPF